MTQLFSDHFRLAYMLDLKYTAENLQSVSPVFRGVDANLAKILVDCGITSVFVKNINYISSFANSDFKEFLSFLQKHDRLTFSVDDVLGCLEWNLNGVFCSGSPGNVERIREIIGCSRFLGLQYAKPAKEDEEFFALEKLTQNFDFFGIGPIFQYGNKSGSPIGWEKSKFFDQTGFKKPVFCLGGIKEEGLHSLPEDFSHGICIQRPFLNATELLDLAHRFHRLLSVKLGPSRFSVSLQPLDLGFKFTTSDFIPAPSK